MLDFGNLEVDWLVSWSLDNYVTYNKLLDPTKNKVDMLQQYIYKAKQMELIKQVHYTVLKTPKTTTYTEEDIIE